MISPDEDLPRLLSGRYRLEATLGQGGMGVVYRGLDLMMKRAVAVKLVRSVDGRELDDDIASRFLREAKNTARLQHEHIIEVFDLGRTDDGGLYFVMELLEGESLSARLKREGRLDPAVTVHIGRQICEGLGVAHVAGVIHRDLKPANIMLLSRAGDPDYVKVLDFGVAKSYASDQDTQLTHTGVLVGTVDYMAPEQIMGKPVDGRTDIYALGIVLYKMLFGKAPFRDNGVPGLIHAHLNTMPKPLIELGIDVPNALDRVVMRCLAKSPDRRYESMAELTRALAASIAPESIKLMSLEYDGGGDLDPYSGDTRTEVSLDPLPLEDPTVQETAAANLDTVPRPALRRPRPGIGLMDDSTLKMERVSPMAPRSSGGPELPPVPPAPRPTPRRLGGDAPPVRSAELRMPTIRGANPFGDEDSAVIDADELSTAKRTVAEELTRIDRTESKTCAMCQTVNAPHARSCQACGVSLGTAEQLSLQAKNRAVPSARPVEAYPAAPLPMPPPFDMPRIPSVPPSSPAPPPMPWEQHPARPPTPEEASVWKRFLSWTGLKNR